MIEELDRKIIATLQDDFPVAQRPYQEIARRLGISEADLLERIRVYQQSGIIRKMGAVLRHREVGFVANVMCVWKIPEENIAETGRAFAAHPAVSHCYARPIFANWPYNMYTMIHGTTQQQCETFIQELAGIAGISLYKTLYSVRELKKSSMRYFEEEKVDD